MDIRSVILVTDKSPDEEAPDINSIEIDEVDETPIPLVESK